MPKIFHAFVDPVPDLPGFIGTKPSNWNAALQYGNNTGNSPSGSDAAIRQVLMSTTTFFVSPLGSDSNDGLSLATAWFSPQHAVDFLAANVDAQGHAIIIKFADGTYPGPQINGFPLDCPFYILLGHLGSSSSVIFQDTGPLISGFSCLDIEATFSTGYFQVAGITFQVTQNSSAGAITADANYMQIYCNDFAISNTSHGTPNGFGLFNNYIEFVVGFDPSGLVGGDNGNLTVTGNWDNLFGIESTNYNAIYHLNGTLTLVGTPAWNTGYINASKSAFYSFFSSGVTVTGTATGSKGVLDLNGNLTVSYSLPGNSGPSISPNVLFNGGPTDYIVATLPTGITVGQRAFVTDSTVTLAAGLGNVVAGTGGNKTPVYWDGTNWRIG